MFAFLRQLKLCSQDLIFVVSSGLVSYLGTWIMFGGYLFLRFKDGRESCQIPHKHYEFTVLRSAQFLVISTGGASIHYQSLLHCIYFNRQFYSGKSEDLYIYCKQGLIEKHTFSRVRTLKILLFEFHWYLRSPRHRLNSTIKVTDQNTL